MGAGVRWVGTSGCAHRSPRPPPPPEPRTVEDLSAKLKPYQQKDWRHVPRFLTPLKPHTVLRGQDCTVTRAFLGNPQPTVTLCKGQSTACWWRTAGQGRRQLQAHRP
ncbi:hypothetical protein Celaphus_00013548, partial [Cervus elaphus hippelaphus]